MEASLAIDDIMCESDFQGLNFSPFPNNPPKLEIGNRNKIEGNQQPIQ
jgi:hypothetical protein